MNWLDEKINIMTEFPNNIFWGSLAACAVGLVSAGFFYAFLRRDRREYIPVGFVSRLYIHPIKSCRGLQVTQTECVTMGIKADGIMDRSFLIIDSDDVFVSQRRFPSLALIAPSLSNDKRNLQIDAPGMPTLTVPLKGKSGEVVTARVWGLTVKGVDCGREAGKWLSQYIGTPGFRLIRFEDKHAIRKVKDDPKWGIKAKPHEKATYPDTAQVHMVGEASLSDLNSRLDKPAKITNFRPNIVVNASAPFDEDHWKYVRIGDRVILRTTQMCARCRLSTVDPDKGEFRANGDPLKTLKEFRMASPDDPDKDRYGPAPLFGTSLAVETVGPIKVGDVVYAAPK